MKSYTVTVEVPDKTAERLESIAARLQGQSGIHATYNSGADVLSLLLGICVQTGWTIPEMIKASESMLDDRGKWERLADNDDARLAEEQKEAKV